MIISMIECKTEMIGFQWYTKFVADLDPDHCSRGATGLKVQRVEVTPRFCLVFDPTGNEQFRVVPSSITW